MRRNLEVPAPNRVWAVDMSYFPTKAGWLSLAVVLDLHSRLVVGWSMGERLTTDLPLAARNMALFTPAIGTANRRAGSTATPWRPRAHWRV
ncbi:MAG: DDE-type integrase/transposase/recombinase [Deinococcota bacterium]